MNNLLFDIDGHFAFLTINRPEVYNALNSELLQELDSLLDDISKENIACLVIKGAGDKAFVAGADISEMIDFSEKQAEMFSSYGNKVFKRIEDLPFPTIAAVNGYALGGGCELALACDIRICSEKSVFGFPETSIGVIPGFGGTVRLQRIVGVAKAKEMIFTCERISASQAKEIGLVNQVCPETELEDCVGKTVKMITSNSSFAVSKAKQSIDYYSCNNDKSYDIESKLFSQTFTTDERKKLMNKFKK